VWNKGALHRFKSANVCECEQWGLGSHRFAQKLLGFTVYLHWEHLGRYTPKGLSNMI